MKFIFLKSILKFRDFRTFGYKFDGNFIKKLSVGTKIYFCLSTGSEFLFQIGRWIFMQNSYPNTFYADFCFIPKKQMRYCINTMRKFTTKLSMPDLKKNCSYLNLTSSRTHFDLSFSLLPSESCQVCGYLSEHTVLWKVIKRNYIE